MSWLKAGPQFAAVTAYNISLTNPSPSESTRKSLKTGDFKKPRLDDLVIQVFVPLGNLAIILPALAEVIIALSLSFPSLRYSPQILSIIGYNPQALTPTPSPLYVAGALLAVLGSVARVQCFRELGKYFTFNIGILKDHALVTSGPYSWVRHPSYTFALLQMASLVVMHAAPDSASAWGLSTGTGSWLREADAWPAVRAVIVLTWGFTVVNVTRLVVNRPQVEDEFLHRHFGKEWEEYARKVRYRLIPGVY